MPALNADTWAQIRYAYEHTETPVEDICLAHGISSTTLRDRMRRWQWTRRRPPIPREGPPPVAIAPPEVATALPLPAHGERSAAGAERGWPGEGALPNPENDENPPDPMSSLHADIDPRSSREQDLSPHSSPNGERSLAYAGRGEQAEPPYYPALPRLAEGDDPATIVPRLQNAAVRVLPAIEATIARLAAGASHPREMEQAGRALSSLTRTLRELNALLAQHQAHPWSTAGDEIPQDMDAFRAELARRLNAIIDAMAEEREEEAKAQET